MALDKIQLEALDVESKPLGSGGPDDIIIVKDATTGDFKRTKVSDLQTGATGSVTSVNGEKGDVVLDAVKVGAAPTVHTHTTAQVNGLDAALASKSPVGHTHTPAEVGLGSVVNTRQMATDTGVIRDQDWDTLVSSGGSTVSNWSGANGPAGSYTYGTLLNVGPEGSVNRAQLYMPHNALNNDVPYTLPKYRSSFNSVGSSAWKTLATVEYLSAAGYYSSDNKPSASDVGAVAKTGDVMSNTLRIENTSSSFNGLRIKNGGNGWSYMALQSGSTESHIAHSNLPVEGALTDSLHLRPKGAKEGSLALQPNSGMFHQTRYGTMLLGCLNENWAHLQTNRPGFHFNKDTHVQGEVYAGNTYDKRVYHQGFKPTPKELGAGNAGNNTAFGGNSNAITTAQFLSLLDSLGAFNTAGYWSTRGTWAYSSNQYINDSGYGNIHLAGAVVEVFGVYPTACTIKISTPTTSTAGGENKDFVYVDNGPQFSPGWRMLYSTANKPTAADVGALPTTGGNLTGPLTVAALNNTNVSTDQVRFDGYGVMGNRGVIYLTNHNTDANASIMIGVGGVHASTNSELQVLKTAITSNVNITAPSFVGNLSGNANTATKFATTRSINGVPFDGTANITIADSTKLPLTGGTVSGNLIANAVGSTKATGSSWGHTGLAAFSMNGDSASSAYNVWMLNGGARMQALGKGGSNQLRLYPGNGTSAYYHFNNGAFTATGSITGTTVTGTSDKRKKKNIATLENSLEKVCQLRGVSYNWKDSGVADVGVIAQEVEKVVPEVVHKDENGTLSVDHGHLVGHLIEAIKTLEKRVKELEGR